MPFLSDSKLTKTTKINNNSQLKDIVQSAWLRKQKICSRSKLLLRRTC